ncbi:MAG TPA: hypothetical protein VGK06_02110 [Methanosarcina sp.]
MIVLVPSKNSMDKLSIIYLLQKYLWVIWAAFFEAAEIEYFLAYMKAKRVIDVTVPLKTGIMETPDKQSLEQKKGKEAIT